MCDCVRTSDLIQPPAPRPASQQLAAAGVLSPALTQQIIVAVIVAAVVRFVLR